MTIKLSKSQKIQVSGSGDIYKIMQQVLLRENKISRNTEHFWIICLANNNQILLIELISLGSVNKVGIEPMDVFSFALQKRAVKIVMIHNHPSGSLKPSNSDLHITDRMQAIGKFIGVPILDHLIISEKNYFSFADDGLLSQIEAESTFDLTFKHTNIKNLKSDIEKLQKQVEKTKNESKKEFAKQMLADNHSVEMIIKYTGLTKKEIERLKSKR